MSMILNRNANHPWTTDDEIGFVNAIGPDHFMGYVEAFTKREFWGRIDRKEVKKEMMKRLWKPENDLLKGSTPQ